MSKCASTKVLALPEYDVHQDANWYCCPAKRKGSRSSQLGLLLSGFGLLPSIPRKSSRMTIMRRKTKKNKNSSSFSLPYPTSPERQSRQGKVTLSACLHGGRSNNRQRAQQNLLKLPPHFAILLPQRLYARGTLITWKGTSAFLSFTASTKLTQVDQYGRL